MISSAFHAVVFDPLYNGLIFLVDIMPGHEVGLAVILLTIIVRIILFPISRRAVTTQIQMKKIAPQVEEIKQKFKTREEQGRAILSLYKENGVRPFASFALILVQLPILIALYWIFSHGGLPEVNTSLLYSFIHVPESIDMVFLWIAMDGHSLLLAILAGATQFVYTRLSMGKRAAAAPKPVGTSFSSDMARSFDLQMRYILPVMVGAFSYFVVAAAPLYWATSTLFMIGQEYLMGRRF